MKVIKFRVKGYASCLSERLCDWVGNCRVHREAFASTFPWRLLLATTRRSGEKETKMRKETIYFTYSTQIFKVCIKLVKVLSS